MKTHFNDNKIPIKTMYNSKKLLLIILKNKSFICFLFLCFFIFFAFFIFNGKQNKTESLPAFQSHDITISFTLPQMKETMTKSAQELLLSTLLYVDSNHPLPNDFPCSNAQNAKHVLKNYMPLEDDLLIRKEVMYALSNLRQDTPLDDVLFFNGAQSYEEIEKNRKEIFLRSLQTMSIEEGLEYTNQMCVPYGQSDHHTGLALDVFLRGTQDYAHQDALMRTEKGRYLFDNLWKYGFVYQNQACENIHLRYVGATHTKIMHHLNLTFKGYLKLLHTVKGITMTERGEQTYVYAVKDEGQNSFQVLAHMKTVAGYDNLGYVILTSTPHAPTIQKTKVPDYMYPY